MSMEQWLCLFFYQVSLVQIETCGGDLFFVFKLQSISAPILVTIIWRDTTFTYRERIYSIDWWDVLLWSKRDRIQFLCHSILYHFQFVATHCLTSSGLLEWWLFFTRAESQICPFITGISMKLNAMSLEDITKSRGCVILLKVWAQHWTLGLITILFVLFRCLSPCSNKLSPTSEVW